jgi:hypothetical protein
VAETAGTAVGVGLTVVTAVGVATGATSAGVAVGGAFCAINGQFSAMTTAAAGKSFTVFFGNG